MKAKKKKSARRFVPPSRSDCESHADTKGWGRAFGAEFFDYFTTDEADPWIDSKGTPVKSWKQKMLTHSKYRKPSNGQSTLDEAAAFRALPIAEQVEEMNKFYRR